MHIPKGPTAGLELALFEPALQAALTEYSLPQPENFPVQTGWRFQVLKVKS